jgi:hypothetical protein
MLTAAVAYAAKVTATDAALLAGGASCAWTTGIAPAVPDPGTRGSVNGTAAPQTMSAIGGSAPYAVRLLSRR